MKQIFFAFILFYIVSFFIHEKVHGAPTDSQCSIDYRSPQKPTRHHLSAQQLKQLTELATQNNPKEGWKLLGDNGDEYAAIAHQVLANEPGTGQWYYQLIQKHWKNSAGETKMKENFWLVAAQHFHQYVEIVQTGTLPDSDQILLSYLKAVEDHNLPELTVFDAAWILSGNDKMQSWQKLNHLDESRTVHESKVCLHSSEAEAQVLIQKDLNPF